MPTALSLKEKNQDTINQAIRELQSGHLNSVGTFTLTANATTTTVAAVTCSPNSVVLWFPLTQDAANDMATTFYAPAKGQFVLTHASNPRVDRTFGYVVLG
jgi:hypothetical protein